MVTSLLDAQQEDDERYADRQLYAICFFRLLASHGNLFLSIITARSDDFTIPNDLAINKPTSARVSRLTHLRLG